MRGEVERFRQSFDILRLYLVVAYGDLRVRREAAPLGHLGVQGKHGHLGREELLQSLYGRAALSCSLPAVFVVHIEYQVYRRVLLQRSRQKDAGEEGLSGAALAEDAVGPFHQLFQVKVDARVLHVQRTADPDVSLVFRTEHGKHVLLGSLVRPGKVGRYGARRLWPFDHGQGTAAKDKLRQHGDNGVGVGMRHYGGSESVPSLGRHAAQGCVRRFQRNV